MNKKKLVISVIIFTMIFVFSSMGVAFGTSLTEIRSEQQKIKGDMSEVQASLDHKEKEYKEIKAQADKKQEELNKAQAEADATAAKVAAIQADIEKQKNALNNRLRIMYKNGSVGFINVVLDSNSMSEFLSNLSMVQDIYRNDQKTLDELHSKQKQLEAEKAVLEQKKAEIEAGKAEVDKQMKELEKIKEDYKAEYNKLQTKYDNLEADAQAITAVVQSNQGAYESAAESGDLPSGGYGGGALAWPVYGTITSEFGYRIHPIFGTAHGHTGIDIAVPMGTPIHAAEAGVVIYSGWYGGYGNAVLIDHGNGLVTLYGHNSSLAVSKGQRVSRGSVVAYAGSTGQSTGSHCHFEVRVGGSPVNPRGYL